MPRSSLAPASYDHMECDATNHSSTNQIKGIKMVCQKLPAYTQNQLYRREKLN